MSDKRQSETPCLKCGKIPSYAKNLCQTHYKALRPDIKKYRATEKGKQKKNADDKKYNGKHKAGYGVLRRTATKKKKILEITLEQYEQLKISGCSKCNKPLTPRSCGVYLIDNKKNFTLDNVITECMVCRVTKSIEDYDYIADSIARLRRGWNRTPYAVLCKQLARPN